MPASVPPFGTHHALLGVANLARNGMQNGIHARHELATSDFAEWFVTFDLTDPAELFIVEFMQRFHASQRGRYRVLAMRRLAVAEKSGLRRLVLQATRFQPQRRGARPEWEVLVWDIDGPGVRFLKRASRAAMMALYRSFDMPDVHR